MFGFKKQIKNEKEIIKAYKSIFIFTPNNNFSQYDMIQFKKEIIGDLHSALNGIFSLSFLTIIGQEKEELFHIDKEEGTLTYIVKNENLHEYIGLINLIFVKIEMLLKKIELHQGHYYNKWKNDGWNLISEFREEWFFQFFYI